MNHTVSTFSWLDTDDQQTRRVREAIRMLDDREALDPLGIGVVRDALAEALFPGTSTIQTRLRYFLFVPWICQAVADRHPNRDSFDRRLRQREVRLIEALRATTEYGEGVIGYRARQRVSRLPTSIYWHGLGAWGVRRAADLSLNQYRDLVSVYGPGGGRVRWEDDGGVLDGSGPVWDPDLPPPPTDFPAGEVTLDLTTPEALYLQERMRNTRLGVVGAGDVPSQLALLAGEPAAAEAAEEPWSAGLDEFPQPVEDLLVHARWFSETIHGAQLLYNLLLAEAARQRLDRDTGDLADRAAAGLADWSKRLAKAREELTRWWSRPEQFWAAVHAAGGRPRRATREFLTRWISQAVDRPHDVVEDEQIRAALAGQEQGLKGAYARLTSLAALTSWNGQELMWSPQRYRWRTVRTLLADLADGLTGRE